MNYTPRQLAILRFILESRRDRGVSPSLREICWHLGGLHVKTVGEHLDRLEEKGAIKRERGKVRGLRVTDPEVTGEVGKVRLAGTIAAGAPIEAIEVPETLDVLGALRLDSGRDTYALRVRGNSMAEDDIRDGDFVIVEKRETASNGETVVAVLENGEATLKRFYREKRRIRLQPAKSGLKPIYARHVEIRGVVRGVLRIAR